jgi:hypothetical protein
MSNCHTLEYSALSPPHSALWHHRPAMHLSHHPYSHCRNPRTHTRRHHWFTGPTNYALSPPHSALIHHRLPMLLPPDPNPPQHPRHPHPRTNRDHWLPPQFSQVSHGPL